MQVTLPSLTGEVGMLDDKSIISWDADGLSVITSFVEPDLSLNILLKLERIGVFLLHSERQVTFVNKTTPFLWFDLAFTRIQLDSFA